MWYCYEDFALASVLLALFLYQVVVVVVLVTMKRLTASACCTERPVVDGDGIFYWSLLNCQCFIVVGDIPSHCEDKDWYLIKLKFKKKKGGEEEEEEGKKQITDVSKARLSFFFWVSMMGFIAVELIQLHPHDSYRKSSLSSHHSASKIERVGRQPLICRTNNVRKYKQLRSKCLDRMLVLVTTSIANDLPCRVHFEDRIKIDSLGVWIRGIIVRNGNFATLSQDVYGNVFCTHFFVGFALSGWQKRESEERYEESEAHHWSYIPA